MEQQPVNEMIERVDVAGCGWSPTLCAKALGELVAAYGGAEETKAVIQRITDDESDFMFGPQNFSCNRSQCDGGVRVSRQNNADGVVYHVAESSTDSCPRT